MADDDERDAKNPIVEEPKSHSKGEWTLDGGRGRDADGNVNKARPVSYTHLTLPTIYSV